MHIIYCESFKNSSLVLKKKLAKLLKYESMWVITVSIILNNQ